MTHFVSREEIQALDRQAIQELGIPALTLMERAGQGAFDFLLQKLSEYPSIQRICVLCGKGNNGGDGFVVARLLKEQGRDVRVVFAAESDKFSPEAKTQYEKAMKLPIQIISLKAASAHLQSSDLIIDALFGVGLNRPLDASWTQSIHSINESHKKVFSLDIPSGMDANTGHGLPICVRANWTATFGYPKLAFQNPDALCWIGEWTIVDIGLPLPKSSGPA